MKSREQEEEEQEVVANESEWGEYKKGRRQKNWWSPKRNR